MRRFCALFLPVLACVAQPVAAQAVVHEKVAVAEVVIGGRTIDTGGYRFVPTAPAAMPPAIAAYGPFRVLDPLRAALVGITDEHSPAAFAAMLRAYPRIAVLEMLDCPGTEEDRSNLRLGRMIRARGIATHVPAGGSVRSGAVELFLAGARRSADPGAAFAVHAWADQNGREPEDYAPSAPENRAYIDYYLAMGMSAPEAAAFYAMTNSVPHNSAKWLNSADMGQWVRLDGGARSLDLARRLN